MRKIPKTAKLGKVVGDVFSYSNNIAGNLLDVTRTK